MGDFFGFFIVLAIGIVSGMVLTSYSVDSKIAIKLSNMMNSAMLDCVTHKIITQEQVHDIETVFHKHIEANFKHIKASHVSYKEDKE